VLPVLLFEGANESSFCLRAGPLMLKPILAFVRLFANIMETRGPIGASLAEEDVTP
jgi:hypothetical protein